MGYEHQVYMVMETERQASRLQGKQVLYQLSPVCLLMAREFNSSKLAWWIWVEGEGRTVLGAGRCVMYEDSIPMRKYILGSFRMGVLFPAWSLPWRNSLFQKGRHDSMPTGKTAAKTQVFLESLRSSWSWRWSQARPSPGGPFAEPHHV